MKTNNPARAKRPAKGSPPAPAVTTLPRKKKPAGVRKMRKLLSIAARHEAGHAVMRKIRGLPATAITVSFDDPGAGFCYGTGKTIRAEDALLVTLAGIAAECHCLPVFIDFTKTDFDDLREAEILLAKTPYLAGFDPRTGTQLPPDVALKNWMLKAANVLWPWKPHIEKFAKQVLLSGGYLDSESVAFALSGVAE